MTGNIKYFLEDLEVGMTAETQAVITEDMIDTFADITGCLLYTSDAADE